MMYPYMHRRFAIIVRRGCRMHKIVATKAFALFAFTQTLPTQSEEIQWKRNSKVQKKFLVD